MSPLFTWDGYRWRWKLSGTPVSKSDRAYFGLPEGGPDQKKRGGLGSPVSLLMGAGSLASLQPETTTWN